MYQPMRNDHRDFDPAGGPWSYILDQTPPVQWRALVAPNLRHATWPFRPRQRFQAIRLSPDWCYLSWGPEYVLAWPGWDQDRDAHDGELHQVTARLRAERRRRGGRVPRIDAWESTAEIDLRIGAWSWAPGSGAEIPGLPGDAYDELAAKAVKLLAFFADAIGHWRAGDQERPPDARDLWLLDHTDPMADAARTIAAARARKDGQP